MVRTVLFVFVALLLPANLLAVDNGIPFVELIRLPANGIAPQVAQDDRGRVHLLYFKGDPRHGDIFYIRADDGGKTFSSPLRVNSQVGSALAIGTVRVPQIAVGKNGRVHVAWMGSDIAQPKAVGAATPMLYARLADAGDRFEDQRNVITQHAGLDGGGSVAADQDGNVYVAWHAPKDRKGEADRWVWVARSEDEGKTFFHEVAANPTPTGSCGCCGMKIAAARDGQVYVLYRSVTDMVHRDIQLLMSKDHARTFQVVAVDPWNSGICVMSTSAFGSSNSELVGAWETKGHVRFAVLSQDQIPGALLSTPGRSEQQKHPAVAFNRKGQFLVTWAEGTGWQKGGSVGWQVFDSAGTPIAGQSGQADGLAAWSMPAAFVTRDDTFGIAF